MSGNELRAIYDAMGDDAKRLTTVAYGLGVDTESLRSLGAKIDDGGSLWVPMFDAERMLIGIRIRRPDGRKLAVRGSRNGIFLPGSLEGLGPLYVCEGPTDTAAAITLNCEAIGLPAAGLCIDIMSRFIEGYHRIVIVQDHDDAGKVSTAKIVAKLIPGMKYRVWIPPCKDLREFVRLGGTKLLLDSMLSPLIWKTVQ